MTLSELKKIALEYINTNNVKNKIYSVLDCGDSYCVTFCDLKNRALLMPAVMFDKKSGETWCFSPYEQDRFRETIKNAKEVYKMKETLIISAK